MTASPYRVAQATAESRPLAVLCEACGVAARVPATEETFRCAACERKQLTRREEAAFDLASATAVSFVAAAYPQLKPFAESVGVTVTCAMVTVRIDGLDCDVSLRTNSGTVGGVELAIKVAGLPPLELRRETFDDVKAKERGVEQEVQTEDDPFDRAVYVSSRAAPADVAVVLASPAVRSAIRHLLDDDFDAVRLTAAAVSVQRDLGGDQSLSPARLHAAVAALRVLAGAPRPVAPTRVRPRVAQVVVAILALAAVPFAVAMGVSCHYYMPVAPNLFVYGLGDGALLGLLSWPLWTRLLRGRSTSRSDILLAWIVTPLSLPLLLTAPLVFVNGAFDDSPALVHELDTFSTDYDDESGRSRVDAQGREPEVGRHTYWFPDKARRAKLPSIVHVAWRPGALGFRWQSSPAELHVDDVVLTEN